MAERAFVVGDVHGCDRELGILLEGLPVAARDTLVFLGDYVDRGPASKAVIDRLLALRARALGETVFLRGNHEDMLLAYLGLGGFYGEAFLANGGDMTARSYGVAGRVTPARLRRALPAAHLSFLREMPLVRCFGEYLMVHAGIRPGVSLEEQTPHDLLWIRDDFIAHGHDFGRTVVFGHTPSRDVLIDLPYKIGLDTGCVYGGSLSAIELPERVLYQVAHGGGAVRRASLAA